MTIKDVIEAELVDSYMLAIENYAHDIEKAKAQLFKTKSDSYVIIPNNIIRTTNIHEKCMNTLANQIKHDIVTTMDIRELVSFKKNIRKQLSDWKDYLSGNIVITDKVDVIPYYEKGTDVNLYTITVWVKDKDTEFPDGFCMDPEFLRNYGKEEE